MLENHRGILLPGLGFRSLLLPPRTKKKGTRTDSLHQEMGKVRNASFNLLVRVVSSGRQGTNNVFAKLLSCEAKFTLEYSKFDVDMIFEV